MCHTPNRHPQRSVSAMQLKWCPLEAVLRRGPQDEGTLRWVFRD